jgi:hypothetical protein
MILQPQTMYHIFLIKRWVLADKEKRPTEFHFGLAAPVG